LVAASCEPFTASVLVALTAPAATFVTCTGVPALPSVTLSCADESYFTASETTALVAASCEPFTASVLDAFTAPAATFVTLTGVPALPSVTLSWFVESYCTALATAAFVVASCDPFTASVLVVVTAPAATFVTFTAAPPLSSVTVSFAVVSYTTAFATTAFGKRSFIGVLAFACLSGEYVST
jgi:hypothetical protein